MYDPLALDRARIDLERLRSRAESAPRRPDPMGCAAEEPTDRRRGMLRRAHRRPATAC